MSLTLMSLMLMLKARSLVTVRFVRVQAAWVFQANQFRQVVPPNPRANRLAVPHVGWLTSAALVFAVLELEKPDRVPTEGNGTESQAVSQAVSQARIREGDLIATQRFSLEGLCSMRSYHRSYCPYLFPWD